MKISIQQAFSKLEAFCAKSATTVQQIVDNLEDNWLDHLAAFHVIDVSYNVQEPYGEQTITQFNESGDLDDLPKTTTSFDGPVLIAYQCDLVYSEFHGDCVPFNKPEMFAGSSDISMPQGAFKVIVPKGCSFAYTDGSSYLSIKNQTITVSLIIDGGDVEITRTAPFIEL